MESIWTTVATSFNYQSQCGEVACCISDMVKEFNSSAIDRITY